MTRISREDILWLYRTDFVAFAQMVFAELHPGRPLSWPPALGLLADRLEAVARGECRRLILNLPPRSLKSHLASVALPLWMMGRHPATRVMAVAGSRDLGADFENATCLLLESRRIGAVFPGLNPTRLAANKLRLANGSERIRGVGGGSLVGRGADLIVVDDPLRPHLAQRARAHEFVANWYDTEIEQRLTDPTTGAVVVVMQRLHSGDLTARLLAKGDGWEVISLPAIATDEQIFTLRSGTTWRRARGELLDAQRSPRKVLIEQLKSIGARAFAAQYLQDPARVTHDGRTGFFLVRQADGTDVPALANISETEVLMHEVFGIGDVHPARMVERLTPEEWMARYGSGAEG